MNKPRIKGKWFGDKYRCIMWKCEEDTFWFYSLKTAIKSAKLFQGGINV